MALCARVAIGEEQWAAPLNAKPVVCQQTFAIVCTSQVHFIHELVKMFWGRGGGGGGGGTCLGIG